MATPAPPVVSVIVVSDYEDRHAGRWRAERDILAALARQDLPEPFEVILVESDRRRDAAPPDLDAISPGVRLVRVPAVRSAELKDLGVGHARADLIAVFEADCEPDPSWLRALVNVLRQHPEAAAVSGVSWLLSRARRR